MSDLYQLQGTRITVAVTGGIAAYKACEVVRLFKKAGVDVSVIMTKAAAEFVTPLTFSDVVRASRRIGRDGDALVALKGEPSV